MKKLFIRSPYFIVINETAQIGSKLELYLWNKGTTEPTTPTYTLSKRNASATQTQNIYNVSNYAKDFIKPIASQVFFTGITEEDNDNWCYLKAKQYKETAPNSYSLISTETYVCLNGYTTYEQGSNVSNSANQILLHALEKGVAKFYYNREIASTYPFVNLFVGADITPQTVTILYKDFLGNTISTTNITTDANDYVYRIPITTNAVAFDDGGTMTINSTDLGVLGKLKSYPICEHKYDTAIVTYMNRYGGWRHITFFKANTQSIEVTSTDYSLLPSSVFYNTSKGQKQTYNNNGKHSIKYNTGWVDEVYFNYIQDMLLSEVVMLNSRPVLLKTKSLQKKTHLIDRMINYELEFEYANSILNNVI